MAFIEGWPHLRGGLYEGFHCSDTLIIAPSTTRDETLCNDCVVFLITGIILYFLCTGHTSIYRMLK